MHRSIGDAARLVSAWLLAARKEPLVEWNVTRLSQSLGFDASCVVFTRVHLVVQCIVLCIPWSSSSSIIQPSRSLPSHPIKTVMASLAEQLRLQECADVETDDDEPCVVTSLHKPARATKAMTKQCVKAPGRSAKAVQVALARAAQKQPITQPTAEARPPAAALTEQPTDAALLLAAKPVELPAESSAKLAAAPQPGRLPLPLQLERDTLKKKDQTIPGKGTDKSKAGKDTSAASEALLLVPADSSAGKQLIAQFRKEANGARSAAYHRSFKATGDREVAARAGLQAKEDFLAAKGVEWKGHVSGPRGNAIAKTSATTAARASTKPRSTKQIAARVAVRATSHQLKAEGKRAGASAASAAIAAKRARQDAMDKEDLK